MPLATPKPLFRKVTALSLPIGKVCEVGVYLPETSNVIDFIEAGHVAMLVEPEPRSIRAIEERFVGYDNVTLHPVAIYKHNGSLTLSQADSSTFVTDLPSSPALVNDRYSVDANNTIEVECRIFADLDDGHIDLLSIDTEGSEWYVLMTLVSRPKVISVETHGKYYVNPFLKEIEDWMSDYGYVVWYRDKSDTVYVRGGIVSLTASEKLRRKAFDAYLWVRRSRRWLR